MRPSTSRQLECRRLAETRGCNTPPFIKPRAHSARIKGTRMTQASKRTAALENNCAGKALSAVRHADTRGCEATMFCRLLCALLSNLNPSDPSPAVT